MYKLSSFNVFQIVVNTNGNEHLTETALSLINDALGPLGTTQGYLDCAHPSFILTHAQGIPFGRKNGFSERRNLCVSLCGLFGGLHARGWRAASKCNLDARKRRSSILFAFSPQQGHNSIDILRIPFIPVTYHVLSFEMCLSLWHPTTTEVVLKLNTYT